VVNGFFFFASDNNSEISEYEKDMLSISNYLSII